MNKNFKVFQIHGLSGLLLLGFVAVGLFCGFVLFPIWMIMYFWNEFAGNVLNGPVINYYQAFLLWIFLALCSYLILKNSISIKIHKTDSTDFEELDNVVNEKIEDTEKNENER